MDRAAVSFICFSFFCSIYDFDVRPLRVCYSSPVLICINKKSRAFVILANGKRSDSIAHPKWIELCTICGKETGNERARLIIMESKLQYINWTIHPMKVLNEVQCNNIIVKMSTTGERKTPKSRWPNERMTKQLNTVSLRRKQILEAFECKVLYFFFSLICSLFRVSSTFVSLSRVPSLLLNNLLTVYTLIIDLVTTANQNKFAQ